MDTQTVIFTSAQTLTKKVSAQTYADRGKFRVAQIGLVGSQWMANRMLHASLEHAGFDCKTIFFRDEFEFAEAPEEREYELVVDLLDELQPGLIGLGFVSYFLRDAIELTERIKKRLDVPVVWGGVHPSLRTP